MSLSLLLLALCVGSARGAVLENPADSSNNTQLAALQALFSSTLGINPLDIKFIPAQPNVFFLVPNQTSQFVSSTQDQVTQPNLLIIPNGILNNEPVTTIASNQIDIENIENNEISENSGAPSPVEIRNNSLVLQNPFDSSPYQSNTETINSLIESIFNNFDLQSLPPEELIFGALPSPNSTVTRTIVQDAFNNEQIPHFRQPTETTTETTGTILPNDLISFDNVDQPESEAVANLVENNFPSFADAVEFNAELNEQLQAPTEAPILTTTASTTTTESPITVAPVVNIVPVSPTLGANFESNRIEPIQTGFQRWSSTNRVQGNIATRPQPVTIRPPKVSTRPRPIVTRITAPSYATIAPQTTTIPPETITTTPAPVETRPPPIVSPKLFKAINQNKLKSLYRNSNKFYQQALPELRHLSGSTFSFELNNKKILGNKPNGKILFLKSIAKEIPMEISEYSSNKITQSQSQSQTLSKSQSQSQTLSKSQSQSQSSVPSDQSNPVVSDKSKKWSTNLTPVISDNLVNIISLPNYKFYLGKKA